MYIYIYILMCIYIYLYIYPIIDLYTSYFHYMYGHCVSAASYAPQHDPCIPARGWHLQGALGDIIEEPTGGAPEADVLAEVKEADAAAPAAIGESWLPTWLMAPLWHHGTIAPRGPQKNKK